MPQVWLAVLLLGLMGSCAKTAARPSAETINAVLEEHFWGPKDHGQNLCAHQMLGRDQAYMYIWEFCGNFVGRAGKVEVMAGESQPVRLTIGSHGQILHLDSRLTNEQLPEILPLWVRWNISLRRREGHAAPLEAEARQKFRKSY